MTASAALAVGGLGFAATGLPSAAAAPLTNNLPTADSVQGAEIAFTSTQGTFVGVAEGTQTGWWQATIDHTPLNASGGTITSGSFVLHSGGSALNGILAYGGTITVLNNGGTCGNQTFGVSDNLTLNGEPGTFNVTLTHYRTMLFGQCITYFATVNGTLSAGSPT